MTQGEAIRRLNTHHHHLMRWGVRTLLGVLRVAEAAMPSHERHRELCERASLLAADLDDAVAAAAKPFPSGWVPDDEYLGMVHALDRAFVRAVVQESQRIAGGVNGGDDA